MTTFGRHQAGSTVDRNPFGIAYRVTVRLVGIAQRQQGTHDSLCAYYSAAMLLCALRPEFDEAFEAPRVALDPLYRHLPRPRGHGIERAVADWLTAGVRLERLCRALNAACAQERPPRTRFRFRPLGRGRRALAFVRGQIDRGLPCLLGWDSRELGNHTSVVVGYDDHRGSESRWLRLLDPIRSQDVLEWGQLERLAPGSVELVYCDTHDGVRPDKLTTERDRDGALVPGRTRVERWEPTGASWLPIVGR